MNKTFWQIITEDITIDNLKRGLGKFLIKSLYWAIILAALIVIGKIIGGLLLISIIWGLYIIFAIIFSICQLGRNNK
jgi:hypothetical protein